MNENIYIGSAVGTLLALVFFLAIAVAIGYVVYLLLAHPETRRAEFLSLGAVSRITAMLIAAVIGGMIFLVICKATFTGFNRIEADGEILRLHYLIPPHTAELRRDQLSRLDKQFAYRVAWRLVIATSDGKTYESVVAGAPVIEFSRLRLAQLIIE